MTGKRWIRDIQKRQRTASEKQRHLEQECGRSIVLHQLSVFLCVPVVFVWSWRRGGNGFGVGVGGGVGGGGEGVGLLYILQAIKMDQSLLYAYLSFSGGCGSSGGSRLAGGGQMHPQRCGGWRRGWQRQGKLSSSYRPRLAFGGRYGHMILHARLNRGDGILCCWWRRTLPVAAHSIGGGGGGEDGSWRKLLQILMNRG